MICGLSPTQIQDARCIRSAGSRRRSKTTTGPLGPEVATCVGLALGERRLNARFGDEAIDHYTFCIGSDGDLQEGINSKASSLAGHLELGRLIVFYTTTESRSKARPRWPSPRDVGARYEAYGGQVQHLSDGSHPRPRSSGRRHRRARRGSSVADHLPNAHRARRPAQAGHRRGARRGRLANRRSETDQAGAAAGPRTGRSRFPRRHSNISVAVHERGRELHGGRQDADADTAPAPRTRPRARAAGASGSCCDGVRNTAFPAPTPRER